MVARVPLVLPAVMKPTMPFSPATGSLKYPDAEVQPPEGHCSNREKIRGAAASGVGCQANYARHSTELRRTHRGSCVGGRGRHTPKAWIGEVGAITAGELQAHESSLSTKEQTLLTARREVKQMLLVSRTVVRACIGTQW